MEEIVVNLHMHTRYSDGGGSHKDIAVAALQAGVDAVIVTDHNVLVQGMSRYVTGAGHRVLVLVGEEVHDQSRDPQKNHLLAMGLGYEVAGRAQDPVGLVREIKTAGGLTFIAHPIDPAAPTFKEDDLSWVDWSVDGFTGIELWNGLSELKSRVQTRLEGLLYGFLPALVARGPLPDLLRKWDELTARRSIVAIGGSDAHGFRLRLGPMSRVIYPYSFHFRSINTHVLIPEPLTGNAETDERSIYDALAQGRCFVGYDLAGSTRGFRFCAQWNEGITWMGGGLRARDGITLEVLLPSPADIRLIRDGVVVASEHHAQTLTYPAAENPGVYRVEAYRRYLGRARGWIFSNPIYVR